MIVEILLLEQILDLMETGILNTVAALMCLRIFMSLFFSVFLSLSIVHWANLKRIWAMKSKWMRSLEVRDKIPNYLLTLFDHLIQFGTLARVRILTDTIQIFVLSAYLLSKSSISGSGVLILVVVLGFIFLYLLYKVFAKISEKTAQTEQDLILCARLLIQRGSSGWSEIHLNNLWEQFLKVSNDIQRLYTIRIASGQGMRSVLEFAVFILVAGGLIIGSGVEISGMPGDQGVLTVLISSRIAPLIFSTFTNFTTIGFGDYARRIYLSETEQEQNVQDGNQ
mgnify:CR=1 FL=1